VIVAASGGPGGDARADSLASLAPTVSDIRIGRVGTATRVVLHLSAETDFIHDVVADGRSVFVAFPRIRWTIPTRYRRTRGIVTGYAFTARDRGGGSLVLATADPVRVGEVIVAPIEGRSGVRIILDLVDGPRAGEPESLFATAPEMATQEAMARSTSAPKAVALATFRGAATEAPRVIAARYVTANAPARPPTQAAFVVEDRGQAPFRGREYRRLSAERERRSALGFKDEEAPTAVERGWRPRVERYDDHDTRGADEEEERLSSGPRRTTLEEQRQIQELLRRRQADATTSGGSAPLRAADADLASSGADDDGFYVSVDLGMSPSRTLSGTVSGSRFSTSTFTGFHALAAGGYDWSNGLRTEGEVAYARAGLDSVTVTNPGTVAGLATGTFEADGDTSSVALMANAAYDLDLESWIKPYVLGGVGGAWVSLDGVRAGSVAIPDASAWTLAYQGGVGASMDRKNVNLRLGYRYFGTSDSGDVADDSGHHAFTLGALFRF
jgi:opacity protein-like surface antigen